MLLDTCALLWLAGGGRHLSQEARDRIENAPVVYVLAISAFKIAVKCRSGKLKLPIPGARETAPGTQTLTRYLLAGAGFIPRAEN